MPKLTRRMPESDPVRDEIVGALLHPDRAQYDELGRTAFTEPAVQDGRSDGRSCSSPREQAAAPIDLHNVDE